MDHAQPAKSTLLQTDASETLHSDRRAVLAGGSIVGNKRTFVKDLDSDVEGRPIKLRYTEVEVAPTFYTYQAEASKDDGPWTVIAEGKVRYPPLAGYPVHLAHSQAARFKVGCTR